MKIIDAHAHIFPEKIAVKASESIGSFYGIDMDSDASVSSLLRLEEQIGTERMLVCSSALSARQVESINDFLYDNLKQHPQFVVYGAMHKDYDNYKEELVRMKNMGFTGVKYHNDMQNFNIDDEKMMPIYEEMERLSLNVLFHMGDDRYDYSAPQRMINIAKTFPKLKITGAHFGGFKRWDEAMHNPRLDNVFYDTSSALFMLDKKTVLRFIDHFGADRFFFGTDFPMWNPKEELNRFLSLGLDDETAEMILYKNFSKYILNEQ